MRDSRFWRTGVSRAGLIAIMAGAIIVPCAGHEALHTSVAKSESADSESGCILYGGALGDGSVTCYIVPGGTVLLPLGARAYPDAPTYACKQTVWQIHYDPDGAPYPGITPSIILHGSRGVGCGRTDYFDMTISRTEASPTAGPPGSLLTVIRVQGIFELCAPCIPDSEESDTVNVVEGPFSMPTPFGTTQFPAMLPKGRAARR